MAVKKSDFYSSLWASCDELRGGMDASQYKDYVLVLLFIKYISDKYAGVEYAPITIPDGASFRDMVALKGNPEIGDLINKRIIGPLANENGLSDFPDFNDDTKLGSGKEKMERLTNLIAIFENPALDFSKNRADDDDLLGDDYEYLMRHFATESGKSKGQFYTPAEVSRVMAKVLGIRPEKRQAILDEWYREQIKQAVPALIAKWESLMGVKVGRVFVQRMKTKWGSCNPKSGHIRLNTDLAKKPREMLEYIIVHEMVHLLEPTHNARFVALMDRFMPGWQLHKQALNRLPVRHEEWEG